MAGQNSLPIRTDDLKLVLTEAQRPLGVKELIRLAGLHPGQQTDLKRALRDLLRAGQIEKEGKRFYVPGRRPRAEEPLPIAGKPKRKGELRPERGAPREPARFEKKRPGGRFEDRGRAPRRSPARGEDEGRRGHPQRAPRRLRLRRPDLGRGRERVRPAAAGARALDNDRVQVEVPDRPAAPRGGSSRSSAAAASTRSAPTGSAAPRRWSSRTDPSLPARSGCPRRSSPATATW